MKTGQLKLTNSKAVTFVTAFCLIQLPFDFINTASIEYNCRLCYNIDNESGFQFFKGDNLMSIEIIGKQIAFLRKEKGIKQEQLAEYVGVSVQAVSKWENGGVPDTVLLPLIADFFSVSIDFLFGRDIIEYGDLNRAVVSGILNTTREKRIKSIFNLCWDIERALFGKAFEDGSIEDYEKAIPKNEQRYSQYLSDYGFTLMGIANKLQYFCLVPEMQSNIDSLLDKIDYSSFFAFLSDKITFDVLVFLNKRENNNAFTQNLLIKNFDISESKANEIIGTLEQFNLLYRSEIELDDDIKTVYNFKPSPSFVAMLIFAHEMIKAPNYFSYYSGERTKPYLY